MTAILITLLAALLGSMAQTTVGFGIALALAPAMFVLLEPAQAVSCTLAASTVLSVLMLAGERDRLRLDRRVSLGLLIPMLPGVVIGATLLGLIDEAYLQIGVGLVVVAFLAVQGRIGPAGDAPRPEFGFRPAAVPSGLAAGVLNGAVSTGGPPLAMWLRSVGASANQLRHTLAVVFIVMNAATIGAIFALDAPSLDAEWWSALAGALAGVPLGYALGFRILERIDEETFERLVTAALVAVGLASAIAGFSAL